MDAEERRRVCQLVEAIIAADGVITPGERAFLVRVAERFGIPYAPAPEGPTSEDYAPVSDPGRASVLLRQLPPQARSGVLALLVESAVVDGEVDPSEHALLLVAAAALQIDAATVELRIRERLAGLRGSAPDGRARDGR